LTVAYLLDTNVVVAALARRHPEHGRAAPWLVRARRGEIEAALTTHCLAETYSILTTLPSRPRIRPNVAWRLIRKAKAPMGLVPLTADDYHHALQRMAELDLPGGVVYDALIARAAEKIDAEALVTFNVGHFRRVWPEGHDRILAP
jgi:predicted nucleic acid-binding protein